MEHGAPQKIGEVVLTGLWVLFSLLLALCSVCQLPDVLIAVWSTAWRIYTAARIELETGGGSGVPPLGCAACGDRPRSLCGCGITIQLILNPINF